jgi:hypothetical protein
MSHPAAHADGANVAVLPLEFYQAEQQKKIIWFDQQPEEPHTAVAHVEAWRKMDQNENDSVHENAGNRPPS